MKAGPMVDIQISEILPPEARAYMMPGTLGGMRMPRKQVAASKAEL